MPAVTLQRRNVCRRSGALWINMLVVLLAVGIAWILISAGGKEKNMTDTTSRNDDDSADTSFASGGDFRCPPLAHFTKEEIQQHVTPTDLWLVVNGNVLDVSSFVEHHPGGLTIMEGAGGDDTATLFSEFHPLSTVKLLGKYCIGRLKE